MAQAGTDILIVLTPGETLVAPMDMTLLGAAASLGTAGTTLSTLTVNHNGVATSFAPTVAASAASGSEVTGSLAIVAGDTLTVSAVYGTTAAGGAVSLWLQRNV